MIGTIAVAAGTIALTVYSVSVAIGMAVCIVDRHFDDLVAEVKVSDKSQSSQCRIYVTRWRESKGQITASTDLNSQ